MKKLSVIIPYHNEEEEEIITMFQCLDSQMGVDWDKVEIIVTNDHISPKNLDQFFIEFPRVKKSLRYLHCPIHFGPGPNRQYAIDNANGEFLMFLDSDDELASSTVLKEVLSVLDSSVDVYKTAEYTINEDGVIGVSSPDNGFLHNKIIRKDFLLKNNIKFPPDIRIFEDVFYLNLIKLANPVFVSGAISPYYIYNYNTNSITRNIDKIDPALLARDWLLVTIYMFQSMMMNNSIDNSRIINSYKSYLIQLYKAEKEEYTAISKEIREDQVGYVINKLDDRLIIAMSMQVKTVGNESFHSWIKRVANTKKVDIIEEEYNFTANDLIPIRKRKKYEH